MVKGEFKLAKVWEKIPCVRSRCRKGNPWLKLSVQEDTGDILVNTYALAHNGQILMALLDTFGLTMQTIDDLKSQAPFSSKNAKKKSKHRPSRKKLVKCTWHLILLIFPAWLSPPGQPSL